MDVNVQIKAAAQDVVAQVAGGLGLANRLFEPRRRAGVLAPDVNVGFVRADAIRRNRDPFQQVMRVAVNQDAVFEGARLRLVGVAHDVGHAVRRFAARRKAHLEANRKARAAPPLRARCDDFIDHLLRRHRERLAQRLVRARGHGLVQRRRDQSCRRCAAMRARDRPSRCR